MAELETGHYIAFRNFCYTTKMFLVTGSLLQLYQAQDIQHDAPSAKLQTADTELTNQSFILWIWVPYGEHQVSSK